MTASKTPLPPEPDWIETLRQLGSADYVVIDSLWPLLCDCIEAAVKTEHPIDGPLATALTRLMFEVQK